MNAVKILAVVPVIAGLCVAARAAAADPAPETLPKEQAALAAENAPAPEAAPTAAAPTAPADTAATTAGSGLFEASQTSSTPPATTLGETAPITPAFELNGYVRGDLFVGKVPGFSQGVIKAGYGELALKVQSRREPYGDAFAEARLRYGQQGAVRDLFVDLREAFVNAYLGPLDLRLGQQIIVWGRADAFNPTNNLTPIDLRVRSPIEDDRRLGNVGLRAFLNLAPVRIEGVWMPLYSPTEYPGLELPEAIVIGDARFPKPELVNGLEGVRVHLELPQFEMSGSYVYGYAPLPGLELQDYTVGVDPTVIRISRTAYDHHVLGFDFSTAVGDLFAIRGEVAYRRPSDYTQRIYAPRPDLQYVLGIDRSFESLSVIVQYLGHYVRDWQRDREPENRVSPATLSDWTPPLTESLRNLAETSINSQVRARNQILFAQTARVQHLASLRLEWLGLHDTLSISALGMLNFTTKEWLVYPKVAYDISDAMTASFGGEIYAGPDGTLFGLIDQELSAGYAELRVAF